MAGESWESILSSYGVTGPPVEGEPSEFEAARDAFDTMYTESNDVYQTFKKVTAEGVPEDRLSGPPGQLVRRAIGAVGEGLADMPRIASEARDVFADHVIELNDLRDRADEALGRARTVYANQQTAQSNVDGAPADAENVHDLDNDLDAANAALDSVYYDDYLGLQSEEDKLNQRTVSALDAVDFGALEAIAPARQLIAFAIDPIGWLEWLAGPDGPSFEDLTALVPGLQALIGNAIDAVYGVGPYAIPLRLALGLGPTAALGVLIELVVRRGLGFEFDEKAGVYTTNEHSIQSLLGYHDVFDKLHKLIGADLDEKTYRFKDKNGVEHRFELWKGGYGAGGAFGGEIGHYTREPGEGGLRGVFQQIPGFYSSAEGDQQIWTTQTIYNKRTGEEYFTKGNSATDGGPNGDHYWNLGIKTDPVVPHEELGQRGTIEIRDPDVAKQLAAQMRQDPDIEDVTVTPNGPNRGTVVSYNWK